LNRKISHLPSDFRFKNSSEGGLYLPVRGKLKLNGTTFCRYLLAILSSLLEDGYYQMPTAPPK
jgi:hypothetical protein